MLISPVRSGETTVGASPVFLPCAKPAIVPFERNRLVLNGFDTIPRAAGMGGDPEDDGFVDGSTGPPVFSAIIARPGLSVVLHSALETMEGRCACESTKNAYRRE